MYKILKNGAGWDSGWEASCGLGEIGQRLGGQLWVGRDRTAVGRPAVGWARRLDSGRETDCRLGEEIRQRSGDRLSTDRLSAGKVIEIQRGFYLCPKLHPLDYLAKTLAGLEEVLAKELHDLGAEKIEIGNRMVRYSGDKALLYRSNLELRTALRVLVPIHRFRVKHQNELYKKVQKVDWSEYLSLSDTFAIDAVTNSAFIRHSHYAALKTKDAIVDQFRNKTGRRPSIDVQSPTLRLHLHIRNDWGTILLDSSGESLHKRGYRQASVSAPINEVLAAGMILLAGWDVNSPFMDVMCGSGTLPIEAAMLAHKIPPQWLRRQFGFMQWKDFDGALWMKIRKAAQRQRKDFSHTIWASDQEEDAIQATRTNLRALDLLNKVKVVHKELSAVEPLPQPGLLMLNPPYDERLIRSDINELYQNIGDQLKQKYAGWEAWIISSNKAALKHIGLRPSRKITLYNGALECKFHKFELYSGSKKVKGTTNHTQPE